MATDPWGIDDEWTDTADQRHAVPAATIDTLRAAMGAAPGLSAPPPARDVRVIQPGERVALPRPAALRLEDGDDAGEVVELAGDLPLGIHELHPVDGAPPCWLIVSPGRCHLPDDLRTWGVTMQVPTTRSRGSWGVGDLSDARMLAQWVGRRGGGALALSPLHAATPVPPLPASPYSPSSRRWYNPQLLHVEDIPGAAEDPLVQAEAARARRLLAEPVVDRDRAWAHQRAALDHLWLRHAAADAGRLAAWRERHGSPLEGWARFCALAEEHGPRWPRWPAELRHPEASAVRRAAARLSDRVAFHAWLQLLLHEQLASVASPGVRVIQDLAIGVDPNGADAWLHQDLFASGISVGAPPDDFERNGQRWGLPPFIPWRLRDAGYRPLADLFRAAMAADGGVRIDHVMGLARLFWIPDGAAPADGAYVRFHGRELLDVLALESARMGALVVGEDLGTVEDSYRAELAATRVLSTRVVWFEDDPPERYPPASLAMVTTHDLPTTAGAWTGADDEELEGLGRPSPAEANAGLHRRLDDLAEVPRTAPVEAVIEQVHRRLAEGASMLVLATMEDLTAVVRRPNVPGTTTERVNWSTALPMVLDDLGKEGLPARIAAVLAAARPPEHGMTSPN